VIYLSFSVNDFQPKPAAFSSRASSDSPVRATGLGFSQVAKLLDFVDNWLRKRGIVAAALATPVIAGYSFDGSPDLTDPKVRERLSSSAIKGFVKIAGEWGLTESQARGLLGGIASSTFHAWKSEPRAQKLSQDTLLRISLVIGIYKALHIYFGEDWADLWVTLGNRGSMFNGTAPIEYMIRQGQPGMSQVRRMLDAWRGGR
jgi:hypothetical protein